MLETFSMTATIIGMVVILTMILFAGGFLILGFVVLIEELYSDWKEKKRMKSTKNATKRIDMEL